MQVIRHRFASDFNGTFNNSTLDTLTYASPYGHPAIIPGTPITSTEAHSGAEIFNGIGGAGVGGILSIGQGNALALGSGAFAAADQFADSSVPGDYLTFTVDGEELTVWAADVLTSGWGTAGGALALDSSGATHGAVTGAQSGTLISNQIRFPAIIDIYINGVLQGVLDPFEQTSLTIFGLTGTSTVKIQHSGAHNAALQPWTAPTQVSGTTLAGTLILTPSGGLDWLTAQWRVVANVSGGGTWKIQKNTGSIASPTWTDQVTGLTMGSADTSHVLGLSVTVPSGSYASNETVQFTTEAITLWLGAVVVAYGSGIGSGSYTSPVLDSADENTAWFLAEWTESAELANFTLKTGQTPTPDLSWATTSVTPTDVVVPSGAQYGMAGLMAAPRGRYAQYSFTFMTATVEPLVRDLSLYYWTPERDSIFIRAGIGHLSVGPNLQGLMGTIAVHQTASRAQTLDFIQSYAISSSIDQYLQRYGADISLVQVTGEPPEAFQKRVTLGLRSRTEGGSLGFICERIEELVSGQIVTPVITGVSGSLVATTPHVTVQQNASQHWKPTIGPPPYAGLPSLPVGTTTTPGTAQFLINTFIEQLISVNSVLDTPVFL